VFISFDTAEEGDLFHRLGRLWASVSYCLLSFFHFSNLLLFIKLWLIFDFLICEISLNSQLFAETFLADDMVEFVVEAEFFDEVEALGPFLRLWL
jgi:hypothetical protein